MRNLTDKERVNAYKIVLEDLRQIHMFNGVYDAENGNEDFMYGIMTVMEFVAYNISDKVGDKFDKTFIENLMASEKKEGNL